MEGSASPRNPRVSICSRSSAALILEVACRSKASRASSRTMPQPLSTTWMSFLPPPSIWTLMRVAPASREFSSSSFRTEAGRSTTSPAAILLATCSESTWIRPMRKFHCSWREDDLLWKSRSGGAPPDFTALKIWLDVEIDEVALRVSVQEGLVDFQRDGKVLIDAAIDVLQFER